MKSDLLDVLGRLGAPRVLVVGDLILDRYVWGDVDRISPEAPIQVLRVTGEESRLGGAANVANNLAALGARVEVVGAMGRDVWGTALRDNLRLAGIASGGVVDDASRPTTVKTRMIARAQQVLRVDREVVAPVQPDVERQIAQFCRDNAHGFDVVVVSDYGKGVLTRSVLDAAIGGARDSHARVLVDPKGEDFTPYRGATLVTPNQKEAEAATRTRIVDEASLEAVGRRLVESLDLAVAIITRGREGMSVFQRGVARYDSPARARVVYDVTGAGDTVLAVLALAMAAGESIEVAADLANVAAAVVVGKVGAVPVSRSEIADEVRGRFGGAGEKVLTLDALLVGIAAARKEGLRIVFTNGCFDILHAGHVQYLQFARAQGDFLVVAMNSDASVRRLKAADRPVIPEGERAHVLAALSSVDAVVLFDDETPLALIEAVRPDVLVKGADYAGKVVVGREVVEAAGGKVVLAPYVDGVSTSAIIRRIASGGK